jgi:hypothetical protein
MLAVFINNLYQRSLLRFRTYFSAYHPQRTDALTKLDSLATFEDGFKYWRVALEDFERENPWTQLPNSANIEMTSYALLSHFLADDNGQKFDDSIPVVEWLFSQQTTDGGKKSLPLPIHTIDRYFYLSEDIKF